MRIKTKATLLAAGLFLSGGSMLPSINTAQAQTATVKIKNISYQTTANLNLRVGAGISFKTITQIPKGKNVIASEKNGNWYKVSYSYLDKGKNTVKTGWVSASFLKENKVYTKQPVLATSNFPKTNFETTVNINLRTGPGTSNKSLLIIPKGSIIYSSEKSGTWFKVSYPHMVKGKSVTETGWVSNNFLREYYSYSTISSLNIFFNNATDLYQTPDFKNKPVYKVSTVNGFTTTQKVINSLGQTWYRVNINGRVLYICGKGAYEASFKSLALTQFKTNKNTVLYSSYGTVYSSLEKIPSGTILSSDSSINRWFKIKWNGKTGFVYSGDLSNYTPPLPSPVPVIGSDSSTGSGSSTPPTGAGSTNTLPPLIETPISGKTFVSTANVNFRKQADPDAAIIKTIPVGTFLFPSGKVSNGWYKVNYNGNTSFVSGDYIKEVVTGDPMNREGYQFVDLRKASKVTAEQINRYIANYVNTYNKTSVLSGKGIAFINAGAKYGVNALYLAAHAILESAYGTSELALGKNNLFGFGAFDDTPYVAAYRFGSVDECIDYIAQEMKSTYLNSKSWKFNGSYLGFRTNLVNTTLRVDANSTGMNFYYATDPLWGKKIAEHMENILKYNTADYISKQVNSNVPASPAKPDGADNFPAAIVGVTNSGLVWESQKGSTTNSSLQKPLSIPKGTPFTLIEKDNDFWVEINVNGKIYWTKNIDFTHYQDYITIKNLGRVIASSLNVRSEPIVTSTNKIAVLNLNDYIQLKLDSNGLPIMDNSKSWYKIVLPSRKEAWVSAQYLVRELK